MLKGLSGFTEAGKLSDYARELAVRALTSAITIVQSHPKAGELWPNWKPHISTIYAYVHSKPLNEPLNKIDKRFLVVVLKNHRILEDCLPGDFVQEVWRKVAANYQKEDALESGEDEGDTNELLSLLFRCMDTNQMKTALDNIINSVVSCYDMLRLDFISFFLGSRKFKLECHLFWLVRNYNVNINWFTF